MAFSNHVVQSSTSLRVDMSYSASTQRLYSASARLGRFIHAIHDTEKYAKHSRNIRRIFPIVCFLFSNMTTVSQGPSIVPLTSKIKGNRVSFNSVCQGTDTCETPFPVDDRAKLLHSRVLTFVRPILPVADVSPGFRMLGHNLGSRVVRPPHFSP